MDFKGKNVRTTYRVKVTKIKIIDDPFKYFIHICNDVTQYYYLTKIECEKRQTITQNGRDYHTCWEVDSIRYDKSDNYCKLGGDIGWTTIKYYKDLDQKDEISKNEFYSL